MKLNLLLFNLFLIFVIVGCSSVSHIQHIDKTIPDKRITVLNSMVQSTDYLKSIEEIEQIEKSGNFPHDPVVKTIRGNLEMLNGDHWFAGEQFREAINLVRDNKMYMFEGGGVGDFYLPERRNSSVGSELREDADIIKEFCNYLHGRVTHRQVLEKFRSRSGFVPYPPIFSNSGTPGMLLELINEQLGNDIFKPRNIHYFNPATDSLFQVNQILSNLGMNLLTVSILSMNLEGIEEAVELLQSLDFQSKDTRFAIGVGLYFLGRNDYAQYLELRSRYLFIH